MLTRGDDDGDRQTRACPLQLLQEVPAVEDGHHHVQQDEGGPAALPQPAQGLPAVGGTGDLTGVRRWILTPLITLGTTLVRMDETDSTAGLPSGKTFRPLTSVDDGLDWPPAPRSRPGEA